jgi:hypothetical protein
MGMYSHKVFIGPADTLNLEGWTSLRELSINPCFCARMENSQTICISTLEISCKFAKSSKDDEATRQFFINTSFPLLSIVKLLSYNNISIETLSAIGSSAPNLNRLSLETSQTDNEIIEFLKKKEKLKNLRRVKYNKSLFVLPENQ